MNFEKFQQTANELHSGVVYGGGLRMYDQVVRCSKIATTADNPELIALAWLHKSQEQKRINNGVSALTDDEIRTLAGDNVLQAIKDMDKPDQLEKQLEKEQKPDGTAYTKAEIWEKMAELAATLSPLAQQMLIVEKIANFQTSRDKPNQSWSVQKHQEYLDTRWKMVEACREASPELYLVAVATAESTAKKLGETMNQSVNSPANLEITRQMAQKLRGESVSR